MLTASVPNWTISNELPTGSEKDWQRALRAADDYYLDGVALNLHGFYAGLERIFELIAAIVDGQKPEGENWHQALLHQMTLEVPAIRPAVISEAVSQTWMNIGVSDTWCGTSTPSSSILQR